MKTYFKYPLLIAVAVFGLFIATPSAGAVTIAELIAQIQELQRQLAQLQSQQGTTTAWCHDFNTNLRIGDNNDEVNALLNALVKDGVMSERSNNFSSDFDETLASAVSEFQEKYASEILAPYRLKRGTGFVGKSTRAKLNKLYGCGVATPTPTPMPTITVTSPNGGEIWRKGTAYGISLSVKGTKGISIYLTDTSGNVVYKYVENYPALGSGVDPNTIDLTKEYQSTFTFTPPISLSDGTYKIKAVNDQGLVDYSDNYFTITTQTLTTPAPVSSSPDLVIENVMLNPVAPVVGAYGVEATLKFDVANKGDSAINNLPSKIFPVVYPDTSSFFYTYQVSNGCYGTASLPPNSACHLIYNISLPNTAKSIGVQKLNIEVDSSNVILESNENNNKYIFTFTTTAPVSPTPVPPTPTLTPTVAPSISVSLDSMTPSAKQIVMGSTNNSLAAFKISNTSSEDVKITSLNVVENSVNGATVPSFSNIEIYKSGVMLMGSVAGSSVSTSWKYSFSLNNLSNPLVVPQNSSITIEVRGGVASYASGGAKSNGMYTFSIPSSADVVARGANSARTATISITDSTPGKTITVLRTKLSVSAPALSGAAIGHVQSSADVVASINFSADPAYDAKVNNVILTLSGLASGSALTDGMTVNGNLIDADTGANLGSSSAASCQVASSRCVLNFSPSFTIAAGSLKVAKLKIDSTKFNGSYLLISINSVNDIVWSDGVTNNLGLQANTVPTSATIIYQVTTTPVPSTYTLSVTKSGAGSGTVSDNVGGIYCGSTCFNNYSNGAAITLTATPTTGSTFTGWSGACSGTGICALTINAAKSVTATFAANPAPTAPSITVTSPNGGEAWTIGSTQKISWRTSNISSPNDKITIYIAPNDDLSKNINIAQQIQNTGFYDYIVRDPSEFSYRSSLYKAGNQFKILVCAQSVGSNDLCSYANSWNNAAFTIAVAPVATPSITVTSPSAGTIWTQGKTYRVTWQSSGMTTVSMTLSSMFDSNSLTVGGALSNSTGGSGGADFAIPANFPAGGARLTLSGLGINSAPVTVTIIAPTGSYQRDQSLGSVYIGPTLTWKTPKCSCDLDSIKGGSTGGGDCWNTSTPTTDAVGSVCYDTFFDTDYPPAYRAWTYKVIAVVGQAVSLNASQTASILQSAQAILNQMMEFLKNR